MRAKSAIQTRFRTAAFALALAAAVTGLIAFGLSSASATKSIVLGAVKDTPKPQCPGDTCNVFGTVTGFGVSSNGNKGIYRIPSDGRIVAWSVEMSKPDKTNLATIHNALGEHKKYGTDAVARLAILKHKKNKKGGKNKSRYTLAKQTPVINVTPNFGHKPIYTLKKPLKVKRGQVAALTSPTFVPNYAAAGGGNANAWKASRSSGKCSNDEAASAKPQMRKGTTRSYGCTFSSTRILYYAYFVKTKGGGGKGGGGGGGKTDPNRVVKIGPSGGPDAASVAPTGAIAGTP
jgi:hypothetical protein